MTLDEFVEEANALARPGVLYRDSGAGEPACFWHGIRRTGPIISVPRAGRWLEVSMDEAGAQAELVDIRQPGGTPLFAEPFVSLPPVDAVFQRGSDRVETFLRENSWTRTAFYNNNFRSELPRQYEKIWWKTCPIGMPNVVAAAGGWPFLWPDSDVPSTWENELVIWTIRDSEPWIEVYEEAEGYATYERVT